MHPSKPSSRAKVWGQRQWVHLALSAAGLGMFAWCCVVVIGPQMPRKAHRHGIGEWVYDRLYPPKRQGGRVSFTVFITTSSIGERLIICTPDSIDDLGDPDEYNGIVTDLWRPVENRTAWNAYGYHDEVPVGLWASTSVTHTISTYVVSVLTREGIDVGPNPPTPDVRVRAMFWDAMNRESRLRFPKAVPRLIAYGNWTGSTIVWSGYAINTATILGLGMWVWCTPVLIRDVIRAWRRKPHMCAKCGYDLRGLTTTVCPECGSRLDIRNAGEPPTVSPAPPQ